ncbi:DNA repair protein RecN [Chloroflexota bacterium]
MLIELRASNFGIIEQISWCPGQGLNILTGETGAGKSLVIDAVETLLSGKADEDVIRYGTDETILEAVFDIAGQGAHSYLRELLAENGLMDSDDNSLVISGGIRRQGRSTFRINGKTVSRGLLNRVGNLLVDIHGQSQHLSLLNQDTHITFLDAYAHITELKNGFSGKAIELLRIEQELKTINEQEEEQARQEEFLRFQIDELKRADLKEGEEEALEKERTVHTSSETLKAISYQAYQTIYGDDSSISGTSALEKLSEAAREVQKLVELDETLEAQLKYVQEVESGLTDVARDIRSYSDRIEYDPQRLQEVTQRLELIRDFKRKYGRTIAEMLDYLENTEKQLAAITTSEERQKQLEKEINSLKEEMGKIASQLSRKRIGAAKKLVSQVNNELKDLNMPLVKFEVGITRHESEEGIPFPDANLYAFTKEGVDIVELEASTNPGEPLKPLAVIASTGEISRFMLALKSALAEADNTPVLIFDEIDIGVGGRSSEIVGKKLWNIARNRQAICITHLPQIAVLADSHFSVHKITTDDRTTSIIEMLDSDEQIKEITVMLSGLQHTKIATENAKELMEKAADWKKTRAESL